MTDAKIDLPASVAARLLNQARQTGDDYQVLLNRFCLERFLYRLGKSAVRDRFVLKGAMLLRIWTDQPYRATRDLDFLRRGDGAVEAIRADIRAVCSVAVEPDAVVFDADGIRIEAIRAADEYAGIRVKLPARCGTARLNLQIDLGIGDAVWPSVQSSAYPVLLDFPAPTVLVYPREAVVAEKLEALVVLGDRNSRIKDFFDLHYLATHFEFDGATLVEAVCRTFARRGTPIPAEAPIGLTPAYWDNPTRPAQVRAFVRRSGLTLPDDPGTEFAGLIQAFLLPVLDALRDGHRSAGTWNPGGPWR
jgi:hypothetical protein